MDGSSSTTKTTAPRRAHAGRLPPRETRSGTRPRRPRRSPRGSRRRALRRSCGRSRAPCRARDPSSCRRARTRSSRSGLRMPGPVSLHGDLDAPVRGARRDPDLALSRRAFGHGIEPVEDQVEEDLLELDPVSDHDRRGRSEDGMDRGSAQAGLARYHAQHRADDLVHVHGVSRSLFPSEEGAHSLHHLPGPLVVFDDVAHARSDLLEIRASDRESNRRAAWALARIAPRGWPSSCASDEASSPMAPTRFRWAISRSRMRASAAA